MDLYSEYERIFENVCARIYDTYDMCYVTHDIFCGVCEIKVEYFLKDGKHTVVRHICSYDIKYHSDPDVDISDYIALDMMRKIRMSIRGDDDYL